ncbi:MAG: type VI secretion system tube protein Hcp [Bryobacteraceae bacterium]
MTNLYLKFSPEVRGESTTAGYVGWIEVMAATWGGTNPCTIGTGVGAGSGKGEFNAVSLTLHLDSAYIFNFVHCMNGKHYEGAILAAIRASGSEYVEYWRQEMRLVFVESAVVSFTANSNPVVSLSLRCGAVELTYHEQQANGQFKKKGPVQWSVVKNDQSLTVS